jgi:predicted amidohydrolase
MKVAAIQFAPEFGAKRKNLIRLARLVQQAAGAGAKLIVLPELAATGYSFMHAREAEPFAEVVTEVKPTGGLVSPGESSTELMMGLASKLGVTIIWGLIEKDYGTGKLYNSQVLVEPDGSFDRYRKVNRWGNDFLWAQPGNGNPPVVKTALGKRVGMLVCRDVRNKKGESDTAFYEKGDADIVAFSANWGDGGFPATTWMEFAQDNKTWLIVSNRYGKETCNNFGEGGVAVISPEGEVFCEGLQWSRDCIVYAEVP